MDISRSKYYKLIDYANFYCKQCWSVRIVRKLYRWYFISWFLCIVKCTANFSTIKEIYFGYFVVILMKVCIPYSKYEEWMLSSIDMIMYQICIPVWFQQVYRGTKTHLHAQLWIFCSLCHTCVHITKCHLSMLTCTHSRFDSLLFRVIEIFFLKNNVRSVV